MLQISFLSLSLSLSLSLWKLTLETTQQLYTYNHFCGVVTNLSGNLNHDIFSHNHRHYVRID